jgi:acyl dehydratase
MQQVPPAPARAGRFVEIGEVFSRELTLDADAIRRFATEVGDSNPLHHDAVLAAGTRFGGLIACGPHTSSLLMAVSADAFARRGAALGLDFHMKFRRAVPAGLPLRLRWQVTGVEDKPSLGGELVTLDGEIRGPGDELFVSARGLVLIKDAW